MIYMFLITWVPCLIHSHIVLSHDLHIRSGVNQSRSGIGRLFGEHISQIPSPHFRLEY
jgi:hypothetical protein